MTAPNLYPEHDLFIQLMKLKHAALDDGRGFDHAPGAGVLRLRMLKAAPREKSRRRMGLRAFRKVIVRIGFSAA